MHIKKRALRLPPVSCGFSFFFLRVISVFLSNAIAGKTKRGPPRQGGKKRPTCAHPLKIAATEARDGATERHVDRAAHICRHAAARALDEQQRRVDAKVCGDGACGFGQQRVGSRDPARFQPRRLLLLLFDVAASRRPANTVDVLVIDDPATDRAHDVARSDVIHGLARPAASAFRHCKPQVPAVPIVVDVVVVVVAVVVVQMAVVVGVVVAVGFFPSLGTQRKKKVCESDNGEGGSLVQTFLLHPCMARLGSTAPARTKTIMASLCPLSPSL